MSSEFEVIENEIAVPVMNWYKESGRDLPWRHTKDPYKIWISEIMLQQTQVDTVIPYYLRFIDSFPEIRDLATADQMEVYKRWEGLGYYRRAANLQEAAQTILKRFAGQFPETYEDVISLKGIGAYTASAIMSIAYEKPYGVIDGNTLRIISRLFAYEDNIALEKTRKKYQTIINNMIKDAIPSVFNQAMMDIGATICTPSNPRCDICPIGYLCISHREAAEKRYPVNIKKVKKTVSSLITGIIRYKDQFMMIKNRNGLLENLYGLVQYECGSPSSFENLFFEEYGVKLVLKSYIKDVKHVFTHKTWLMHVYYGELSEAVDQLYSLEELELLPISTAHQKALNSYFRYIDSEV